LAPDEVLLRWRLPIAGPDQQRRALQRLWHRVPIYTRRLKGIENFYPSRQPHEAWFTVFTRRTHVEMVIDSLRELFGGTLVADSLAPILGADLAWYRARVHQVADIALNILADADDMSYRLLRLSLDVLPDPATLDHLDQPSTLYEKDLGRRLMVLAGPALERAMAASVGGTSFWGDFLRRPHRNADVLPPPGHYLWNLSR
jgi:hypothetical protein